MTENIYLTLINRKIETFIKTYGDDADSIYKRDGKVIHPGEYGVYRERSLKQLLERCLRKAFSIGDGFVINKFNEISTQCDVVIFDTNSDTISIDGVNTFYPVEVVYSIGEVKSTLNKSTLKEALRKLAKIKMTASYLDKYATDKARRQLDQVLPVTFLLCKNIEDFNSIDSEYLDDVYKDYSLSFRHNIILSIDDGCIAYRVKVGDIKDNNLNISGTWPHAIIRGKNTENVFVHRSETDKYFHIYLFLAMLRDHIEAKERFAFPFIDYLGICNEAFENALKR